MTTDGTDRTDEGLWVDEPLGSFWVTGELDDPSSAAAIVRLLGSTGLDVRLRSTDPGVIGALAEMLWECAIDLAEAQMFGVEAVIARKGAQQDEDEVLTVADVLAGRGGSPTITGDVRERRPDIEFPWQVLDPDDEPDDEP